METFKNIENLVLYKEYPARESKNMGLSAKQLYNELKGTNLNVSYCGNVKDLKRVAHKFPVVAFVGAGDIGEIAKKIIQTN